MSKPPAAMKANERHPEKHFPPDEHLFRRVPLSQWDDPLAWPGADAVKLPDMSVGRSKFAHPEWLRFDVVKNQHYEEWGILGVKVEDIPPEFWDLAVYLFTFEPQHDPQPNDYPHSEVRAFNNSLHVRLDDVLPEEIHLKWRLALLKKMRAIIKPYQIVPTRQLAPVSHRLEPLPGG